MIFGLTTNEAAYFVAQALTGPSKSNSLYNILVDAIFGKNSSAVLDCYPPEVNYSFAQNISLFLN